MTRPNTSDARAPSRCAGSDAKTTTPKPWHSCGPLTMAPTTPVCHDDIFGREAVRNARAVDDALREMGPVVKLARENITLLARHEHVSEGLRDWQTFSS